MSHSRVILALELAGIITLDTVMYAGLAFFAGMAAVISHHRLRHAVKKEYEADDAVAEAIVMEYTRRLREYDRVIAELRTRVDVVELRSDGTKAGVISQDLETSQPQHHVARVTEHLNITPPQPQRAASVEADKSGGQNGTTDYILKMLAERPRSAKEVQQAIGRTREHTSRLLKRLSESQLVVRDARTKPFSYSITDLGRERLREKTEVASEVRTP